MPGSGWRSGGYNSITVGTAKASPSADVQHPPLRGRGVEGPPMLDAEAGEEAGARGSRTAFLSQPPGTGRAEAQVAARPARPRRGRLRCPRPRARAPPAALPPLAASAGPCRTAARPAGPRPAASSRPRLASPPTGGPCPPARGACPPARAPLKVFFDQRRPRLQGRDDARRCLRAPSPEPRAAAAPESRAGARAASPRRPQHLQLSEVSARAAEGGARGQTGWM